MKPGKKSSAKTTGQLRIIAGALRGRKLHFTEHKDLRPTPDRVRETLFNWLQFDIAGSSCLDCFAGSGALGFEAASRGASLVTLVDGNDGVVADLQSNNQRLQAESIEIVSQDVIRFLRSADKTCYDLVFLDPPYQSDLLQQSVTLLEQEQWLSNHAKIYIETNSKQPGPNEFVPECWRQLKSSRAGQVACSLWQRS